MNKSDILELHFITYIDNVPSILSKGFYRTINHTILIFVIYLRMVFRSAEQKRKYPHK